MTVLNYAHHTSVAGGYDTVDKVRTFAVAQGWVQNEWITGYSWNMSSPYGFTVVDPYGCFLELSSPGYGSQNLEVRVQHQKASGCSTHYLFCNMTNGSAYAINSTCPWAQNGLTAVNVASYYTDNHGMNIGNATYDDLWIFGDDKFIMAVCSMDGVFCQQFLFGSMHMFKTNPTEGACRGFHMMTRDYPDDDCPEWQYWESANVGYPAHWPGFNGLYADNRYPAFDIYWDGGSTIVPHNAWSMSVNLWLRDDFSDTAEVPAYLSGVGDSMSGALVIMNVGNCLKTNAYSNKRPMLRMVHFGKRSSDSLWIPICKTPYYFLNTAGLSIGEVLTYGSEEFMCFPIGPYYSPIGIGVQIA